MRREGREAGGSPDPSDPSHGLWSSEKSERVSHPVESTLQPRGLQPARLLCPWDSPGRNTGVGCHSLLQGTFRPGIEAGSLALARRFLMSESPGEPQWCWGQALLALGPQNSTGAQAKTLSTFPGWRNGSRGLCSLLPECGSIPGVKDPPLLDVGRVTLFFPPLPGYTSQTLTGIDILSFFMAE